MDLGGPRPTSTSNRRRPGTLKKDPERSAASCRTCAAVVLNLFRQIVIYLSARDCPNSQPRAGTHCSTIRNSSAGIKAKQPLVRHAGREVQTHDGSAIEREDQVNAMFDETTQIAAESARRRDSGSSTTARSRCRPSHSRQPDHDRRLRRRSTCASRSVIAAEEVPEARKLLRLTLSLGGNVTRRTVFAGIKGALRPGEQLVGRQRRDGREPRSPGR